MHQHTKHNVIRTILVLSLSSLVFVFGFFGLALAQTESETEISGDKTREGLEQSTREVKKIIVEKTPENIEEKQIKVRARAKEEIQEISNQVKNRIQQGTAITEERRAEIEQKIEEKKNALETHREELKTQTQKRLEEIEQAREERTEEMRERAKVRAEYLAERMLERLHAALDRLEGLVNRLESRFKKLEDQYRERGFDLSTAKDTTEEAKRTISATRDKANQLLARISSLGGYASNPGQAIREVQTSVQEIVNDIKHIHSLLKRSVEEARQALKSVRGENVSVTPSRTK